MKNSGRALLSFLFMLMLFNCPPIMAANNIHTLVSLQQQNITILQAVQEILNQAGIQFNSTLSSTNIGFSATNLVSPAITNTTWSEALGTILSTQNNLTPLTYRAVNSQIVLYYQSTYPTTSSLAMNFFPEGAGSTSPLSSSITVVTRGKPATLSSPSTPSAPIQIKATPIAGYHFVNWTGSANLTFANSFSNSTNVTLSSPDNNADSEVVNNDATVIAWFAQDDLTNGLVAYYPFNGDASDESGNGNDGTVYGATLVPNRFGNPNRAYSFNGVGNYINCGNNPSLNLSTFSISYWVNSDHVPGTGSVSDIICKGGNYSSSWDNITNPNPGVSFSDGTTGYAAIPTSAFSANKWYHIVGTYNKDTLTIYVNGISNSTVFTSQNPQTNTVPLCIGAGSTSSDFFRGSIDDLRIYNRALAPSEITKLYTLASVKLTTVSSPAAAGSVTPSPNITVNSGDPVQITAYPSAGYRFSKWSISGTATLDDIYSQVATVDVNANSTVTATFVADSTHKPVSLFKPYPVAPTDKIQVQNAVLQCLNQVGILYDATSSNSNIGTVSTQTITPDIHNALWSDALDTILEPLGITYKIVNSKVVLYRQSQFSGQSTLVMNFTPNGSGITTPSSGLLTTTVNDGEYFDIQALPSANYHFVNWSGASGTTITDSNTASTTASLSKDSTISANFAHDTSDLTMSETGNGSTSPLPGTMTENTATAIPITATPDLNNHFLNWTVTSGTASIAKPTATATTVTLTGGHGSAAAISANFARNTATLTTISSGNGTAEFTGVNPLNTATEIPILATPAANYHFVNWTAKSGSVTIANPAAESTTVTLTGGHASAATIAANFAINTFSVVFTAGANGSISGTKAQTVKYGANCTSVTPVPAANCHFTGWTGDHVGTESPLTLKNITSNMALTANFARNTATLTVNKVGNGTAVFTGSNPLNTVTAIPITANADADNHFVKWTVSGPATVASTSSAATTVKLTGGNGTAATVTANFATGKAVATVTITNLNQVYNGLSKPVTVTTVPSGLKCNITYAGNTNVPVNAGKYAVTATVEDNNFAGTKNGSLIVAKANQAITFQALPTNLICGDPDYPLNALAASGLPVTYASSNQTVAAIVSDAIHINGAGTSTIKASQAGNANWNPAPAVSKTLTIGKKSQNITFPAFSGHSVGDDDFDPGATTTSNLQISYTSANRAVATIVNGKIHIVNAGSSVITATQSGNANFKAATAVKQTLTVTTGGQPIALTPLKEALPAATARLPSEGIVFVSNRDGVDAVWVMDEDGSNPRRLSSTAKDCYGDNYPSSSPDGSRIVFTRAGAGIIILDDTGEEIVRKNAAGADPTDTTWSYNGKIYFGMRDMTDRYDFVYSMETDGTGEVQASPACSGSAEPNDHHPSLSPDGLNLLFSTNRHGNGGTIVKMNIGDASIACLTYDGNEADESVICPAEHPTWSPDGTKIAFAAHPGFTEKEQIYVMKSDGSEKVQLTSETGADCRFPSWSPDGAKIVFQKDFPSLSGTSEIWIMNSDGSGGKSLTDRNATNYDAQPCFIKKPR